MHRGFATVVMLILLCAFAHSETTQSPAFQDISASLFPVNSASMSWGDFDNDGDLDLAYQGVNGGTRVTRFYRNNGDGTFTNVSSPLIGFWEGMLEWGDFDGDGLLDIGESGWDGGGTGVGIWHSNGGGSFTRVPEPFHGMKQGDGHFADFDNDGRLDLLTTGESYDAGGNLCEIYRNTPSGFVLWKSFPGVHYGDCAAVDFDNDGDIDLLVTGGTTKLYRNDGNGVFTELSHNIPALSEFASVAFGDYDNDGDFDFVIAGNTSNGPYCEIFRNEGGNNFVAIGAGLPALTQPSVAWGDIDNDGDLDLIVAGTSPTGEITRIYRNDNGVFTLLNETLPPLKLGDVKFADFDNDGRLDLVLGGNGIASIFRNIQNITPNTPPTAPPTPQTTVNGTAVTFSWGAASDDTTPALGLSYNMRVGTAPGLDDVFAGMSDANGVRKVAQWGNVQKMRQWKLALAPGTYYWNVQAIDAGLRGGAWSTTKTVFVSGATANIAAPNGGETFDPAQVTPITWTTSLFFDSVELSFSSDGGATYSSIATVPYTPATFNWTVPNTPSTNCKIRILRVAGGQPVDESDATFTISTAPVKVTALSPAPGSTHETPLSQIVVTFDTAINPATVTNSTFHLIGAGPDTQFGTADDILVPVTATAVNSTQVKLSFNGAALPKGTYGVLINGRQSALKFDGGNDVVFVPDQTYYQFTSFTLETWVRIDTSPAHSSQLVFRGDDRSANDPFSLGLQSDGRPYIRIDTPSGTFQATAPTSLSLAQWIHLAGTYDSTSKQLRLLQNGVQIAAVTTTDDPLKTLSGSGQGVSFGNLPDLSTGFNGYLHDVRIWNRAFSAAQIQGSMSVPLLGTETGLVGYWPLNEGKGQRAFDFAANANHAFLGLNATPSSDDPAWVALTPLPGVRDVNGRTLDGEFGGTFPSGNNSAGGDFIATLNFNAQAPIASNQTLVGTEDTPLSGTVTATDANSQSLTYILLSPTEKGTLQFSIDGTFNFAPNANFNGTDTFTFKASDGNLESNVGTVTLTINPVNDAPKAALTTPSGLTYAIGESAEFSAADSSDIDDAIVSFQWDFGDGSAVKTVVPQSSHIWISAGIYTVTLTVTDAGGLQNSVSLTVVVAALSAATGIADSDGDGFSDEMEIASQTDPFSALSTPIDNRPLAEIKSLRIEKLIIALNLKLKKKDNITMSGALPVPEKFSPTDKQVVVDVGGIIHSFVLDKRAVSTSKTNTLRVQLKRIRGIVASQFAAFSLQSKSGTFADAFTAELGVGTTQKEIEYIVPVTIIFNDSYFEKLVTVNVTSSPKSLRAK